MKMHPPRNYEAGKFLKFFGRFGSLPPPYVTRRGLETDLPLLAFWRPSSYRESLPHPSQLVFQSVRRITRQHKSQKSENTLFRDVDHSDARPTPAH